MNQEYIIHKELKDMLVYWFEDIEELSSKLTSGNVSHQGATIRNKAIRCYKFIKEYCKTKNDSITDFERGQWSVIQNVIGYVENYTLAAELCREAGIGYKKIKALQKDCGYSYKEEVNNFIKESKTSGTYLKLED